jgi:hypothetical protein
MGRLLEVAKSILTWLDRLHPVLKIIFVIVFLFPRSPLAFPPLSVYLIWRWTPDLNRLLRIGIVGVSVLVTISWFSGLYYFSPSSETAPTKIAEKVPVGPPELVSDATYKRLMSQKELLIEEVTQVLNYEIQTNFQNMGQLIGPTTAGLLPLRGAYELVMVFDINQEPGVSSSDPKVFAQCGATMAGFVGMVIGKLGLIRSDLHIINFRFLLWKDGMLVTGVISTKDCHDIFMAWSASEDPATVVEASRNLVEKQMQSWGRQLRPPSMEEMWRKAQVLSVTEAEKHYFGFARKYGNLRFAE